MGLDLSQRKRVIPYMGIYCKVEPLPGDDPKKHAHIWASPRVPGYPVRG
ncbi:hypothetical protein LCGC14_2353040, partial [marine sediment metagenome]